MGMVYTLFILVLFSGNLNNSVHSQTNNKFYVLLNLLKFKPMQGSDVFRTFSDTILLPGRKPGETPLVYSEENGGKTANSGKYKHVTSKGNQGSKFDEPEDFFQPDSYVYSKISPETKKSHTHSQSKDKNHSNENETPEDFVLKDIIGDLRALKTNNRNKIQENPKEINLGDFNFANIVENGLDDVKLDSIVPKLKEESLEDGYVKSVPLKMNRRSRFESLEPSIAKEQRTFFYKPGSLAEEKIKSLKEVVSL